MECFNSIVNKNIKNIWQNIFIIIISIIISVLQIYRSYYIGQITQNKNYKDVFIFIGIVITYYILHIFIQFIIFNNLGDINSNFMKNVLNKIFGSKFEKIIEIKDNILSNLNISISEIGFLYQDFYNYYISNIISIISTVTIFIYYMPKVSIIILSAIFIIGLIYIYFVNYLNKLWEDYIKEYHKFDELFQNIILNMWNIKYNSLEKSTKELIYKKFIEKSKIYSRFIKFKVLLTEIPGFLFFSVFIINIFYIIKNKNIKTGTIVFLIFQLYKIWRSIDSICANTINIFNNIKNVNKICPVWYLNPMENKNGTINNINKIQFNNVKYSYEKNKKKIVLNNMNFNINKGEIVYIDGPSGKGKSTIINLICRLFDVKDGEIIINDKLNIKDIDINILKNNISVIPQNITVFNNSIKDNIILDNEYDKSRLDFLIRLLNLPNENQDASQLSQGQKQRVLIGRTLYNTNKSVYIFDEYLSAVDKKTSMKIHNYVIEFIKQNNKIGIFISHDNDERVYYDKIINI